MATLGPSSAADKAGGVQRLTSVMDAPGRARPRVCKALLGRKVLQKISSILLVRAKCHKSDLVA